MALDDRRPIEWRSYIAQAYCHYRPKSAAKQDKEFLLHVARVVHPDLNVRVHACREIKSCTLSGHGEVRRVTDVLLEACNDLDSQVRTAAAEAAFAVASWQDTRVKEAMIRCVSITCLPIVFAAGMSVHWCFADRLDRVEMFRPDLCADLLPLIPSVSDRTEVRQCGPSRVKQSRQSMPSEMLRRGIFWKVDADLVTWKEIRECNSVELPTQCRVGSLGTLDLQVPMAFCWP